MRSTQGSTPCRTQQMRSFLARWASATRPSPRPLAAACFGGTGADWAGPGTGHSEHGIGLKAQVIDEALALHAEHASSPFEMLRRLGGTRTGRARRRCPRRAAETSAGNPRRLHLLRGGRRSRQVRSRHPLTTALRVTCRWSPAMPACSTRSASNPCSPSTCASAKAAVPPSRSACSSRLSPPITAWRRLPKQG